MGQPVTRVRKTLQILKFVVTTFMNDPDEGACVFYMGLRQLAERFKRYTVKPLLQMPHPELIFAVRIALREAIAEAVKVVADLMQLATLCQGFGDAILESNQPQLADTTTKTNSSSETV